MRKGQRKNKAKQVVRVGLTFSFMLIIFFAASQNIKNKQPPFPPKKEVTPKQNTPDTLKIKQDSTIVVTDTLHLNNISKDSLDAPVQYAASDSGVLDIPGKKFYLYGKSNAKYQSLDLSAAIIEIDNQRQIAKAYGIKDSSGNMINRPVIKEDDMTSESDSIFYNLKTQKGLTKKTLTKQGEMFVFAERIKKVSPTEYFASKGRFTTCNLDTPHFAFRTSKMKLVNNKWAYSGVTYPEFEEVPLPIGIPFGIFPLNKGRHSGILPPTFSVTQSFGMGLEGLGYYKVLNEYIDLTVRTNIYSYGGFLIDITPNYRKRYRYNGGLNISMQRTKINFKGDPDFSASNTYSFRWNHAIDAKARPGTNFNVNINVSSSKYNQFLANNPIANFTNMLTSGINYSKNWEQGKYNLSLSASHNQNNTQHLFNISLPNITFNTATLFPFKKAESIGEEKWYEKLGFTYNTRLQNQFAFYDTTNYSKTKSKSLLKHLMDTAQWGVEHSIPLTLNLPALGSFQIVPSVSLSEKWFGQKNLRSWNPARKKLDTLLSRGFFAAREVTTSLNLQTALFGTFNFKSRNLVAIRHTIRPNFSINYKPDLVKKFYYDVQVDTTGRTAHLSAFEGSPIGGFSEGMTGSLNFSLNQQLEAKVKDKTDTTGKATKKIRLIDNFDISTGYNFFAPGDTCKLYDISIILGTTLFNKININASTAIVPYVLNKFGNRTRKYAWENGKFSLGSINNARLSITANFQSKTKDNQKKKESEKSKQSDYYNPDEELRQQEYIRNHPAEFTDFNIPWTLSLSFSMGLAKVPKPDYSGFSTNTTANLTFSGDFSLTPKWKIGGNGFIDAKKMKIDMFSLFISREMHCWQLSINVTPVGSFQSFGITINPKSSILRDLRINRTRTFQNIL